MSESHNRSNGTKEDLSTGELMHQVSAEVSALVRDEIALATAEVKRKGKLAGLGAGLSGAGGLLALYALGALVVAAGLGLAEAVDGWLAALIVGVVLLAMAGLLAMTGIGKIKSATPPVPEEAVKSTQRDVETVKEHVQR